MGVGLDLRGAKRVAIGTREVVAFGTAGGAWWRPSELAPYYGASAAGQVPFDGRLDRTDRMTLSGSLIRAVENDGGIGAPVRFTAVAGEEPSLPASGPICADFSAAAASHRKLVCANPLDLQGTHFLVPVTIPAGTNARYIGGYPDTNTQVVVFKPADTTAYVRIGNASNNPFPMVSTPNFTVPLDWALFEMRVAAGRFRVWLNKVLVGDVACSTAAHPMSWLGMIGNFNQYRWIGKIGRMISVMVADATTDYPAIAAARRELNITYGTPA